MEEFGVVGLGKIGAGSAPGPVVDTVPDQLSTSLEPPNIIAIRGYMAKMLRMPFRKRY